MRRPVRLQIKQKKYRSPKRGADELPFPMNCLCSTCRLTLIPGGLSGTLPLSDYGRVARPLRIVVNLLYSRVFVPFVGHSAKASSVSPKPSNLSGVTSERVICYPHPIRPSNLQKSDSREDLNETCSVAVRFGSCWRRPPGQTMTSPDAIRESQLERSPTELAPK